MMIEDRLAAIKKAHPAVDIEVIWEKIRWWRWDDQHEYVGKLEKELKKQNRLI